MVTPSPLSMSDSYQNIFNCHILYRGRGVKMSPLAYVSNLMSVLILFDFHISGEVKESPFFVHVSRASPYTFESSNLLRWEE